MLQRQLALLMVVFALLPSTIYSALLVPWIGFILLLRRGQVSPYALKPAYPALLLLLQGIVFGEFSDLVGLGKDGWYYLKMLLVVQAGALIGYYTPLETDWIKVSAWAAMLVSIDQVVQALLGAGGDNARHIAFVSLTLTPFILKYYRGSLWTRWFLVSPTLLTIFLAQSRTGLLVMAIAYLGTRGVYLSKARMTLWIVAIVSLAAFLFPLLPEYEYGAQTLGGKLRNSIAEISFEDGSDRLSMYANWRGFEAYRALVTWQGFNFFEQLFGGGFGQNISLGSSVYFGTGEVSELPFAHNGYFTVLVKSGLVGVALFVYFMAAPFIQITASIGSDARLAARLATTSSLILLLSTVVISGPLNKESMDGVTLIFGFALGALQRARVLAYRHSLIARASSQTAA
ncbi:O-antigen ligase family protein [Tropicimonas sp. TH_r6]|uniref:O-antigen ligase family protein n=1 Tax=Tropicimonas sp. TH_r6 TaxID=3082085 RepID=UPI0029541BA8|nr:O-antigen ligase family protein [Tropicimonas sp. TH_r6]MDV7144370.1 O-antigen ligase family protein [Tropicimonas sp. TH_r6]